MIPHIKGKVAKQAHVGIPEGTFEEEYARNGFFGRYAHLYRSSPPVNWTNIEGPLKPRAYDLNGSFECEGESESESSGSPDYVEGRRRILFNDDVVIAMSTVLHAPSYYFRNADADEVLFVHEGSGRMETDFGPVDYSPGDYLIIPRGTVYRISPNQRTQLLVIESFSEVNFPEKGMLGQHALFDPAVIQVPSPEMNSDSAGSGGPFQLWIKRCNEITCVTYPSNPINTVGWKGTLCVQKMNVKDIRPVLSDRYHLPPSAHTTLVANHFVICTFLPRPLENGDPAAMKVPFYHSNIDFDEVIFYHSGDFFSRDGIRPGMMTFHPQGIHHGPQKRAIERSSQSERTNEVAVMIDTRRPLFPSRTAEACEVKNYWRSWQ